MSYLHHDFTKKTLDSLIQTAINKSGTQDEDSYYDSFVTPPNPDMGDLAFGCFPLAKTLRKSPVQIATMICENLENHPLVASAQAAGPYINFNLNTVIIFNFSL